MRDFSYDRIPYESDAIPSTHPIRMATVARLFGLSPTPVSRCRVLELGCGNGANLIPLAQGFPGSRFLGVDLARRQIEAGQNAIRDSGLQNVELRNEDLLTFDADGEKFDYIVAHGLYSWVPAPVRDRILQLCHDRLAEDGVALVSYNVYPGWHLRGTIRDMSRFHASLFDDAETGRLQARALVRFLAESVPTGNDPYGQIVSGELKQMIGWKDGYHYHEILGEENHPVYFHRFVDHAKRHGLAYLGESEFPSMLVDNFPPAMRDGILQASRDIVTTEQYMDFLRNRMFRLTLLTKASAPIVRSVRPDVLRSFWIGPGVEAPTEPVDLTHGVRAAFRHVPSGREIATESGLVKRIWLATARAAPNRLSFAELLADLQSHAGTLARELGIPADEERIAAVLGAQLMSLGGKGMIELCAFPYPKMDTIGAERPKTGAYARVQAREPDGLVTNFEHRSMQFDLLGRQVFPLLDGTRTRAEATQAIVDEVQRGTFKLAEKGQPVQSAERMTEIVSAQISAIVAELGRRGYLLAS